MGHENHTFSNDFILLERFTSSQASLVFFSFIFTIFVLTVTENTVMILIIHRELRHHTPMYFLFSHLSFMDILHISNIVLKMVTDFPSGSKTIWFAACGVQIFLSLTLLGGESLLLAAMSYDHYVAICHPLRYPILMNDYVSVLMAGGAWFIGIINSIVHTAYTLHFPFCGTRVIDHFFCKVPAMLMLSCVNTTHYESSFICLCKWHHFPAYPFLSNLCFLCPNSPYCPPNETIRGMEKVIFYLFLPRDCSHNVLWAIYFHIHET